jgi:hypothetical protein
VELRVGGKGKGNYRESTVLKHTASMQVDDTTTRAKKLLNNRAGGIG